MSKFNIIVDMDWLLENYAIIDCQVKVVTFETLSSITIGGFVGIKDLEVFIRSMLEAQQLLV